MTGPFPQAFALWMTAWAFLALTPAMAQPQPGISGGQSVSSQDAQQIVRARQFAKQWGWKAGAGLLEGFGGSRSNEFADP